MAPIRGKRNAQLRDSLKEEDILQAIVIADSFCNTFDPITLNKPTALLPLVSVPFIDYTLEFLCDAGVQEITVFCCNHADQIRKHLEKSKWQDASSPCSLNVIVSEDCLSLGDALRDIDSKAMIRTDFILVFGDTVASLKLKDIMENHRKKKEVDKSSVLTLVYKKAAPGHHARCPEDETLLVLDSDTHRILDYRKKQPHAAFHVPVEVFSQHQSVAVHYDLMDTHVFVCSPLVPQLFTDNFDYSTMDDLVRGLLVNEEILGNTIYTHIVKEEYASRVVHLSMYDAVSRDVMNRWTYPYVPELMCLNDETVSYGRHSVYTSHSVTLARGCILKRNVFIGSGTCINTNSTISNSVIGRNCKIGENVIIRDSYIWDNVEICDDCLLDTCIVCDGAVVRCRVTVSKGCVISWKVDVGPNILLPTQTLLTSEPRTKKDEFSEDADDQDKADVSQYGSKAFLFHTSCDSDTDEGIAVRKMWGLTIQSDEESSDASSIMSRDSDVLSHTTSPMPDDSKVFYSEMLDTLRRAKEENIAADNQVLEINSLKHAYNITIRDVNMMVMQAVLEMPLLDLPHIDAPLYFPALKKCIKAYLGVVKNYIRNPDSQLHCLESIEESSLQYEPVASALVKIIHFLYEADIIQEEIIVSWYENVPDNEERSERLRIRNPVAPFIKWLQEADEESDDSPS